VGRDRVVGIETRYKLDGLEVESLWGRDFLHPSRPALGFIQPPMQWAPNLSGDKAVGAWRCPPNPTYCWSEKKSRAVSLLPLWAFVDCSRSNISFFTSYGRTYSKAHHSHFTGFSTVSDHNNFKTRTVLSVAPIIINNPQFFSDTNYIISYNYRVSFMGVAFSDFLNEPAQPRLVFLSTSYAW
jgi:hypothetical protein